MVSKLFIFGVFAIVLLGFSFAEDYEGGEGEGESDESYDAGEGGGDYSEGEGEGDYAAAAGDGGEETDDSAAASHLLSQMLNRKKRSVNINTDDSKRVLRRVRRGGKGRVGPVYTYQKTDHHGNFKWGVKHNVGSHYGGHGK